MKYVGLDLHARTSTLAVFDPHARGKKMTSVVPSRPVT